MERVFELANKRRIRLVEGDITRIKADAIVNAANSRMAGGGGVDGAIHRAGGPEIMLHLDRLRSSFRSVPPGQAVATVAGRLPARLVIHAVGPVYRDGASGEPETLASCYRTCLRMAEENGCRSLTFPSISTGVYGYPMPEAARVAIAEVKRFLLESARQVDEVILVQFDAPAFEVYERELEAQCPNVGA